ncbi:hypothetical protein [Pseudomonas sp. A34-9]|uniref:hypothetical protein n=1 Tax=Pseudomonas sp. A34-9 TaxID=3034675 RepID=UPI00240E5B27|nr:hypothetical protein [Pseudomonas sp. A34-9]
MNFDQAKSLRLQQWRATLDDQDFRMQNPEGHRETLREMASALCSEGLINQLEQFELNEMADAAYWHAVEELQDSSGQYRGASTYGVVQVDTGSLLAIAQGLLFKKLNRHENAYSPIEPGGDPTKNHCLDHANSVAENPAFLVNLSTAVN